MLTSVTLGMRSCLAVAFADADTNEDSARPAAIVNALLWNSYAPDQVPCSGLTHLMSGDLNGGDQPDAVLTHSHGMGSAGVNQYSQRVATFLNGWQAR